MLKIRTLLIFEISKKIDKVRLAVRYWTVLHAQEELGAHISTGFRSRMIFWKNHLEKKNLDFFSREIFSKKVRNSSECNFAKKNEHFRFFSTFWSPNRWKNSNFKNSFDEPIDNAPKVGCTDFEVQRVNTHRANPKIMPPDENPPFYLKM